MLPVLQIEKQMTRRVSPVDRQILRVDRIVLRVDRRVPRVDRRVLRVDKYCEWEKSTTGDQTSNKTTQ